MNSSPKQKLRPLPFRLSLSFSYGCLTKKVMQKIYIGRVSSTVRSKLCVSSFSRIFAREILNGGGNKHGRLYYCSFYSFGFLSWNCIRVLIVFYILYSD